MALKAKSFGRFAISCDDPFQRKCKSETSTRFSEDRARLRADELGWSHSFDTLEDACPTCIGLQKDLIEKRKALGKIASEDADFSDPFTTK